MPYKYVNSAFSGKRSSKNPFSTQSNKKGETAVSPYLSKN
ncbi:hypothetical protein HMPREF1051_2440 [Neisseria sicca VK64]|uniref:Uncharacterized protein n=1 Tax=Neisseria sicca VK64 TaxID=1095748 RepID=I2NHA0_NEISI|nr:hypothetical protein HMPREF1051_2440 [Neisseria sicca VK64]